MAKKNKNAHLPEATFGSFMRSLLFYIISIPSILSGGFFLIPLFILLPFKWRWFCLTRLLSLLILQAKYIAGINYKVSGLENLPNTPYVALSKHQSPWETFFLFILLNPVSTVMKRSLLLMPSFGWGIAMAKPIPIDRKQPKQAIKALIDNGVKRLKKDKMPVLVFPEGTRVPYGQTRKYSRGGAQLAQKAAAPAIFIAHNAGKCWPSGKYVKYAGTINVVFSKPLDSTKYSAKELMLRCEQWIENQVQIMA